MMPPPNNPYAYQHEENGPIMGKHLPYFNRTLPIFFKND